MVNLKNNCACYDCGKEYLTESQLNSKTHNQTTYFTATCMLCREEKGVTDIRAFNGLRKLPLDIESYHGGKILKNEIVFCDIYTEDSVIYGVVYKYDNGNFKRLENKKTKGKSSVYYVEVLDIKVIHSMGVGKD